LIDLQAKIELKNQLLQVNLTSKGVNLILEKDNLKAKLNSSSQSKIDYNLETKKLEFSGACDIDQADISGLEFLGQVSNLSGRFIFNQQSLASDNLKAELLGRPFKINLTIKDFSTKALNISTDLDLSILPEIAKERFNFSLINSASGKGVLSINIHPDEKGAWIGQGSLNITGASLKLDKPESLIENIGANLKFSPQGLSWANTKFRYQGINYQSSGTLSDFTTPKIKLKLSSQDLSVAGDFTLTGNKVKLTQVKGKYLDSRFLISGELDRTDPAKPLVDLTGRINLELSNLNKFLEKTYPVIKTLSPSGQLDTQFNLSGPVTDFKNCYLQAKSTSSNFSVYGLKTSDLSLDYVQAQRVANILALHFAFYNGVVEGSATVDFNTPLPIFHLELKSSGINLEKLKNDTPSKNKNIAGIYSSQVKLNGAGSDLSQLTGAGSFAVNHGRLGELNLLQGLGKLLLSRDLSNIEFSECSCSYLIKDKFVYTDNLKLSSSIVILSGPVKIGFDNSLEGALEVDVLSEMIPADGTFKDVATAVIGQGGGKFGLIKLGGTLVKPKYSFKTDVGNIIQGLANVFLKK
jgi:hypothetical protein